MSIKERLAFGCYRWVFTLATPWLLWRLYQRAKTQPAYFERKRERWGWGAFPPWSKTRGSDKDKRSIKVIWLHAVSVGETLAAKPLIHRLLQDARIHLVLTCSTPTGSDQIQSLCRDELPSDRVFHAYAPYDQPSAVYRFLHRIQPDAVLVMETELWPTLLHACCERGIPSVLVNGRLSEKSARGYAKVAPLSRPMLGSLTQVLVQTPVEAERFQALGAPNDRVTVTGSIKLDISVTDQQRQQVRQWQQDWQLSDRPVLVAASTHPGEESLILQAWQRIKAQQPHALLILAPRHVDRARVVLEEIEQYCPDQHVTRRSDAEQLPTDIVLVDTLGELSTLFGVATVAIMGGTFVERGGHNFIEPALWGVPTLCGESDFNFADISRALQACDHLRSVSSTPAAIESGVMAWWSSEADRRSSGQAGAAWVAQNRGALQRVMAALEPILV